MREFVDLAQAMGAAKADSERLMLAAEAAVELVEGCVHAGITINQGGDCRTVAGTSDVLAMINSWQNELAQGPCHEPDRTEEVVVIGDLSSDERWQGWGARVHGELGLGSMISLIIVAAGGSYGTLSLYADRPGAFDGDDLATAQALAGHLAVSLAASREIQGLGLALSSRTVIGQAEGIIMERLGVDADQALAFLKRISSHANKKLVAVAMDIVETRELPGIAAGGPGSGQATPIGS